MIHDGAREQELAAYAFRDSDTLLQSGARLVAQGTASAEEVLRVCQSVEAQDGVSDSLADGEGLAHAGL